jgi:hypothetical protein
MRIKVWGLPPGVETSLLPDGPDVLDGGDALQPSLSLAEIVFRHAQNEWRLEMTTNAQGEYPGAVGKCRALNV